MTPAALALLLPVASRPAAEERLSSWLSRIARIYGLSASALVAHFGLAGSSALTLEKGLSVGQGALIAARTGLSESSIDAMTFATLAPHARFMIAPSARYFCPRCAQTPAIGRKDAALPWTFWCSAHGVRLWARAKRPMESFLPESVLERLDPLARRRSAGGMGRGPRLHLGNEFADAPGFVAIPDHALSGVIAESSQNRTLSRVE